MKKESLLKPFTIAAIAALMLVGFSSPAPAQDISQELKVDHKVIGINEKQGLVPNPVIIKPGTTVIWLNYSRDPMEIKFMKQQTTVACRQPVNFILNKEGVYQSQKLETGAVASLCFIQKGEYEYQLEKREYDWNIDPKLRRGIIKVY